MDTRERFRTHEVDNQPPPLAPYDAFATDLPLREALAREGGDWARDGVAAYGLLAGGELVEHGRLANAHRPQLRSYDRYGHRLDEVDYHPSWHHLMDTAVRHGVTGFGWRHAGRAGAQVARAALMYLHNQADQGSSCPLTMTFACVPVLRQDAALADHWLPRAIAERYDARPVPPARPASPSAWA